MRKTYSAGVFHHGVSEAVVSLGLELQVVGGFEDDGLLQVARLLVLVAHRVLAVVGDGLRRFFGQQANEGHLHSQRVCRLVFVAVGELQTFATAEGIDAGLQHLHLN